MSLNKKTILVELSERTEILLCLYAVGWSIFIALFQYEDSITSGRYVLGLWIGGWAVLLTLAQWKRLRVRVDYTAATLLLRWTPNAWAPHVVRIWPLSIMARLWLNFWFTVWWLLMAFAVLRTLDNIDDIRLLAYVLVALLHFDRFLRLLQRVGGRAA